jgi:hypothetical protein
MKYAKYLLILLVAPACKKGSSLRGSMKATINGKSWSANCKNNVNGQLTVAYYNQGMINVLGEEVSGPGDTSIIVITYDEYLNPGQNQAVGPDEQFISYITKTDTYSSNSPWSSGNFYWTEPANDILGSFDGTLYDAQYNGIQISVDFDAPTN